MKWILFIAILLGSTGVFANTKAKLSPKEIQSKCNALPLEKRQRIKACISIAKKSPVPKKNNIKRSPAGVAYYSVGDPYLGPIKEKNMWSVRVQGMGAGQIQGLDGSVGYVFSQMETGLFASSFKSKKNSEVGDFEAMAYGVYFSYNYLPVSSHKLNLSMTAKLGGSSLLIKQTDAKESYPYLGLGAALAIPIFAKTSLTVGADLHQVIHPEKNLFHLGSSLGLGLRFDF